MELDFHLAFDLYNNNSNINNNNIINNMQILRLAFHVGKSRGRAVGITTGYVQDDLGDGVRVPVGSRVLTSPYRPD
jgi:hypothetical protein